MAHMTIRKRASAMTVAEQTLFKNVITALVNAPGNPNPYGVLVGHHAHMAHNTHTMMGPMGLIGRQRFLPWHRDYLRKVEMMGKAINPGFFIPYWKWTTNRAVPPWLVTFLPTVKVAGPDITVTRSPGAPASLPTTAQVNAILLNATYTGFTAQLEGGPHNTVHTWVGGATGTMSSISTAPADPLFWLHHAMIDKIWADWQVTHPGLGPTLVAPNTIMDPWTETANSLQSITTLGYSYGP